MGGRLKTVRYDFYPTAFIDKTFYTKEEIDGFLAGISFDFFLNNTASDIGTYFVMDPTQTGDAESSFSDTITGDGFLIDSFATSTTEPTFTELVSGIFSVHIHAETTVGANVKTVRLYFELYKRTHPGGTETLLFTSEESEVLTDTKTAIDVHGFLSSDTVLASTDRFVLKIYANIEDGDPPRNTNPLVTLYAEGTLATRFELKTIVSAFDERYLLLNGSNANTTIDIQGQNLVTRDIECRFLDALTVTCNSASATGSFSAPNFTATSEFSKGMLDGVTGTFYAASSSGGSPTIAITVSGGIITNIGAH